VLHPGALAADITSVDALPAADAAPATTAILARLGAGRFAIDLAHVAEVGNVPPLTRVPGTPAWVAGVANWRGRILPALDLRTLLGAPDAPLPPSGRLVVLHVDTVTVGVLVDAVDGTTDIGAEIAAFPAALTGAAADLLIGQLPREEGPVAVLDAGAVIRLRGSLPQARHSA
jgi:purine-binding chemotaxis protein CheW